MTPKEKANELVNKYFIEIEGADRYAFNLSSLNLYIAKQCALIAVDEILELTKRPTYNPFDWNEITGVRYDEYWTEVKQEIEKL